MTSEHTCFVYIVLPGAADIWGRRVIGRHANKPIIADHFVL